MTAATAKRFGPFEIIEPLGNGGMASVYKAFYSPQGTSHCDLLGQFQENEVVALKIANAVVVHEPILAKRFHNEYRITRQLQHPNLVRALGYGVENELPFLVLEYVPGQSLDKLMKNRGPLPVDEALTLIQEIALAVNFIHQHNLVHRDIHPGNILVDTCGNAKLADLGLMKDLDSEAILTNSKVGLGTLGYSAPEQLDDAKHADHRCDVYGLAATLYVALTGKFPFGTGSPMQVIRRKLEHRFVPLSQKLSGVSLALDEVIVRSLHPDPAVRPASVEDFVAGILGKRSTQPVPVPRILFGQVPIGQGRRSHVRYPVELLTTMHDKSSLTDEIFPVKILDVSTGGLSLQSPQRFDLDSLLEVSLPNEYAGYAETSSYQVCIRWIKKIPEQGWLLGCSFLRRLEGRDLERFLLLGHHKTDYLPQVEFND